MAINKINLIYNSLTSSLRYAAQKCLWIFHEIEIYKFLVKMFYELLLLSNRDFMVPHETFIAPDMRGEDGLNTSFQGILAWLVWMYSDFLDLMVSVFVFDIVPVAVRGAQILVDRDSVLGDTVEAGCVFPGSRLLNLVVRCLLAGGNPLLFTMSSSPSFCPLTRKHIKAKIMLDNSVTIDKDPITDANIMDSMQMVSVSVANLSGSVVL